MTSTGDILPRPPNKDAILGAGSIASVLSIGSIASIGSLGSISSLGSAGSIGSVGSIASTNKVGAIFNIPVAEKPASRVAEYLNHKFQRRRRQHS